MAAANLMEKPDCPAPFLRFQTILELRRHDAVHHYGARCEFSLNLRVEPGDGGIDGIIKEDRLGLESVYVQAKRWEATVGRPDVQQFTGALHGRHARKGVMITTSSFSRDAIDCAKISQIAIVLVDGVQLADFMIEFGVGVTDVETIRLKKLDEDYFLEE